MDFGEIPNSGKKLLTLPRKLQFVREVGPTAGHSKTRASGESASLTIDAPIDFDEFPPKVDLT